MLRLTRDTDIRDHDRNELLKEMESGQGYNCLRLADDYMMIFTRESFRHACLMASRIHAVGGDEALTSTTPTEAVISEYRKLYGEWASCYETEEWYATHGGARRRIMAHFCTDRAESLSRSHPLPDDYVMPASLEEVATRACRPAVEVRSGKPRKASAQQATLF